MKPSCTLGFGVFRLFGIRRLGFRVGDRAVLGLLWVCLILFILFILHEGPISGPKQCWCEAEIFVYVKVERDTAATSGNKHIYSIYTVIFIYIYIYAEGIGNIYRKYFIDSPFCWFRFRGNSSDWNRCILHLNAFLSFLSAWMCLASHSFSTLGDGPRSGSYMELPGLSMRNGRVEYGWVLRTGQFLYPVISFGLQDLSPLSISLSHGYGIASTDLESQPRHYAQTIWTFGLATVQPAAAHRFRSWETPLRGRGHGTLHRLHVWYIYQHLPQKWPSYAGKYAINMGHLDEKIRWSEMLIKNAHPTSP